MFTPSGLISPIRFAETVLYGPAPLATVPGSISPGSVISRSLIEVSTIAGSGGFRWRTVLTVARTVAVVRLSGG